MLASSPASILNRTFSRAGIVKRESELENHALAAVKTLRDAGIAVRSTPGLRIGLVIVDDQGHIFTPTALYLEPDQRAPEAPNALRMSREQVTEALARLSPAAKVMAVALAGSPEERERLKDRVIEVPSVEVASPQFAEIEKKLRDAPPVKFDVVRQVRVFEPYLQYVEIRLAGAAIQRRRIVIPKAIQNLGADEGLQSRLKTTFDLIERTGPFIEEDRRRIERDTQGLYEASWQGSRTRTAQGTEAAV